DDRAAARLFCSKTLAYIVEKFPEDVGLAVYLFLFGDLIDAFESRKISHHERVKMVLQAKFFKDLWKACLHEGGYSEKKYYLSHEADDICDILINGYLSLVIIHRDHLEQLFPFLPWLVGTGGNEHIFGELRKEIPDFRMLDVLHTVPKIEVSLVAACRARLHRSDSKRTASGYQHTYFGAEDADLRLLAEFPSDSDISAAATAAYEEAISLWQLLGYNSSGLRAVEQELSPMVGDSDEDNNDDVDDDREEEVEDCPNDASQLQATLDETAEYSASRDANDTALDECNFAALAMRMENETRIQQLPDEDPEAMEAIRQSLARVMSAIATFDSDVYTELQKIVPHPAPTTISETTGEPVRSQLSDIEEVHQLPPIPPPMVETMDLQILVQLRRRHETQSTANSVRTGKAAATSSEPSSPDLRREVNSQRYALAKRIHEIVRCDQSNGSAAGQTRQFRWTKTAMGSTAEDDVQESGNSANAKSAAQAGASAIIRKRRQHFAALKCKEVVSAAKIGLVAKLQDKMFVIVMVESQLFIGQVLTMYQKGGGKHGKHSWVSETDS
ncbi:hypothetical protein JAAARDRAFT_51945, partial [Jaapia argillacea MUCL 33604]